MVVSVTIVSTIDLPRKRPAIRGEDYQVKEMNSIQEKSHFAEGPAEVLVLKGISRRKSGYIKKKRTQS